MRHKILLILSLMISIPANAVEIEDDKFSKSIIFRGERKQHAPEGLYGRLDGISYANAFLIRSWLEKDTGHASHQLYINHTYFGREWIFWHRASDENANSLDFVSISQKLLTSSSRCCEFSEIFGIDLPSTILEKSRNSGLLVKVFAKSGDQKILRISAEQIASQLFAIEQKKISLSTQAPSVPKQSPQRPATDSLGLTNGPQDLLNCKIGTSALVRTTSEKCELAGGVKVQ